MLSESVVKQIYDFENNWSLDFWRSTAERKVEWDELSTVEKEQYASRVEYLAREAYLYKKILEIIESSGVVLTDVRSQSEKVIDQDRVEGITEKGYEEG